MATETNKSKNTTKKYNIEQACVLFSLNFYDKKVAESKYKGESKTKSAWEKLFKSDKLNIKQ